MTDSQRRTVLKHSAGLALLATYGIPGVTLAQSPGKIRIGHIQALTGPSGGHGSRARDGARLAIDEINAAGGMRDRQGRAYTIEVEDVDMANDPKQAISLVRQFVSDPSVNVILGPTNSVGFLPMTSVVAQFEIPLIGNGSGAPIKEWNVWTYRVNPVADVATPVLIRRLSEKLKFKRLAIVFDQTQEVQVADASVCRRMKADLGYEIVADEAYKSGEQDFSAQITKIRFARPDLVFVAAAPGDGVKVTTQIRESGIKVPMATGFGSFNDVVYWDGSGGAIAGGFTWIAQDLAGGAKGLQDWVATYNKRFKLEATAQSAFGYDSVYALAEAVKRTDSPTRKAIGQALANLELKTPINTSIKFKNPPHGNNLDPTVTIIRITGRNTYEVF